MNRSLETLAFLTLAGVAHLLFFWAMPDEGISAGGVGGDKTVSLMAVAERVETMVAEWEAPPQAIVEMPDIDLPTVTEVSAAAALTHRFSSDAQVKISALEEIPGAETSPDAAPRALPTPLTRALPQLALQAPSLAAAAVQAQDSRPKPSSDRSVQRAMAPQAISEQSAVTALPAIDTSAPPPPVEKPKATPKSKPKKKPKKKNTRVAEQARSASAGRAEEKAAGQGGQAYSGANGAKTENAISKGKREKAEKVWKSKVYRRLSRFKRRPKGRFPAGRVGLRFSMDRNGNVISKGIYKSSGVPEYDKAALQAVARAGKFPAPPSVMSGATFTINLPLKFE